MFPIIARRYFRDVDECASKPCQHGASCTESSVKKAIAFDTYACRCAAGWRGFNCAADTDECASAPCQNNATCVESNGTKVPLDSYSCACARGWESANCDKDTNECLNSNCLNDGNCTDSTTSRDVARPGPTHRVYLCGSCTLQHHWSIPGHSIYRGGEGA